MTPCLKQENKILKGYEMNFIWPSNSLIGIHPGEMKIDVDIKTEHGYSQPDDYNTHVPINGWRGKQVVTYKEILIRHKRNEKLPHL